MTVWNQVVISFDSVASDFLEYVSFLLFELGAQGTEVKYAPGYLENHPNLFGEIPLELPAASLNHRTQVYGYFSENLKNNTIIPYLNSELMKIVPNENLQIEISPVEMKNWQSNWMEYYEIQHISRFIKVVPIWKKYQALSESEHIIYLDPGVAFGTGDHPTTQLGAQALEIVMRGGEVVLDVGTGSGVLAFIASSLGAAKVFGYDLDPQAVEAAKRNLTYQPAIQKLKELKIAEDDLPIQFQENNLLNEIETKADIIVANILPHILVEMLDDAYHLLNSEGFLILGGILKEKTSILEKSIDSDCWDLVQTTHYKGWAGFIFQKKAGN